MKKIVLLSIVLASLLNSCVTPALVCDEKYIPDYLSMTKVGTMNLDNYPELNWKLYHFHWISDDRLVYVKFPDEYKKYVSVSSKKNFQSYPDIFLISLAKGEEIELSDEQQKLMRSKFNSQFRLEVKKESFGKALGKAFLSSDSSPVNFVGWIKASNSEAKINYDYYWADRHTKKGTVRVTEIILENEELNYKRKFDLSDLYISLNDRASVLGQMQVDPNGRYVKFRNYLLDIKTGEKVLLFNTGTGIISNNWREILFAKSSEAGKHIVDFAKTDFTL